MKNKLLSAMKKNQCMDLGKKVHCKKMDDVLSQAFHQASSGVGDPSGSPPPPPPPPPPPVQQQQQQQQQPMDGILSLIQFLLAVQAASPETPEGLSRALGTTPVPSSLDAAANAMSTVFTITPAKLNAVLGPAEGANPDNSPRAMFRYLLQKAVADGGPSMARASLQAVLVRWLQKTADTDPGAAPILSTAGSNLDAIHGLTANGTGAGNGQNNGNGQAPPSALKAVTPAGPSRNTIIAMSVSIVILMIAVIVLLVLFFKQRYTGPMAMPLPSMAGGRHLAPNFAAPPLPPPSQPSFGYPPPPAAMGGPAYHVARPVSGGMTARHQPTFAPL